ncbi:MAG TPA: nucleoside monophosphate kinase [Candidatus Saccharimonadia bacterium]|nr:nucleoside monophosphate kinase [Candidatus Saccharimonadia bacterium]
MIIFLGLAGSGKTTQAKMLAKVLGCRFLSLGELLRNSVDEDTKAILSEGKLLNDSIVFGIVDKYLEDIFANSEQFILDGFPRTYEQAKWLIKKFQSSKVHAIRAIHLVISNEETKKRLLLRHRQDDNPEAIQIRFSEYQTSIKPIIAEFESNNIVVSNIDGSRDIASVHKDIMKAIGDI